MASQKFSSTISFGYMKTLKLTPLSSWHRRGFTETGSYQRFPYIFPKMCRMRYMFGIRTQTRLLPEDSLMPLKSVKSSAYYWLMWKVSQHQKSKNTWMHSHKAVISYLRLMSPLPSKIQKLRGLGTYLRLVAGHRSNVYLLDRQ